jgi:hypothetical protein
MGHIEHDAIVVTTSDNRPGGLPNIDAFRATLPEAFRPLVVGPVPSVTNGYVSYAFLPDGSKTGWGADTEGEEYREAFTALFNQQYEDGSTHDDAVALTFGNDHREQHGTPAAVYVGGGVA